VQSETKGSGGVPAVSADDKRRGRRFYFLPLTTRLRLGVLKTPLR